MAASVGFLAQDSGGVRVDDPGCLTPRGVAVMTVTEISRRVVFAYQRARTGFVHHGHSPPVVRDCLGERRLLG